MEKKPTYSKQTRLMGAKIDFLVQCLEVIYQYQKKAQTKTLALSCGPALGQSLNDKLFCLSLLLYPIPAIRAARLQSSYSLDYQLLCVHC